MKLGELGSVVADFRARLVHFTIHDVRRRPILGLYFVIGAMVASYVIYLVIAIAKDLGNPGRGEVPVTTAMKQGQQAPGTRGTGGGEANAQAGGEGGSVQTQETPTQGTALPVEGGAQQTAAKAGPEGGDRRDWRVYVFPDRCQISFPGTWQESKVPAEKGVIHGIRLELPLTVAAPAAAGPRGVVGKRALSTLTQNAYVGADIGRVMRLDTTDPAYFENLVMAVTTTYDEFLASAPEPRMAGIADRIAERRPDLVSLQEVYELRLQTPGDLIFGGSVG